MGEANLHLGGRKKTGYVHKQTARKKKAAQRNERKRDCD